MRIAFATKHFLEPTHHAIRMTLNALGQHQLIAFARRFECDDVSTVTGHHKVTDGRFGFERAGVDLVHVVFDGQYALRAVIEAGSAQMPCVLSFHGGFDTHVALERTNIRTTLRDIQHHITVTTVPCESDRERLLRIMPRTRCEILPVPIDDSLLPRAVAIRTGGLIVCRLIEKKGVDVALDMMALFRTWTDMSLSLHIVGDGVLRGWLEAERDRRGLTGQVTFMGSQPLTEVLRLLVASEVLIHPGRVAADGNADGVPQIILWAFATRTPVVASDAGSIREIIRHEVTGLLAPSESPGDLAAAVRRLRVDARLREHVKRSGALAIDPHRLTNVVRHLERLYGEAVLNACTRP